MRNSDRRAGNVCRDGDGEAQIAMLAASFPLDQWDDAERRMLAFLGASVLTFWHELPPDARRRLLSRDNVQSAFDPALLKARIARFAGGQAGERPSSNRPFPMRPGVTRVGRGDDDFVDRAKMAYKQDGGAGEPAHYSHINELDGKRVVVLRNKRGVLAVYEDVEGLVTRLARWPVSWD